jgi:hypothetical protein
MGWVPLGGGPGDPLVLPGDWRRIYDCTMLLPSTIDDLVAANRILVSLGVHDGLGHVGGRGEAARRLT